jgi:hypothetical protein
LNSVLRRMMVSFQAVAPDDDDLQMAEPGK